MPLEATGWATDANALADFLAEPNLGRVATTDEAGEPHVVPAWFWWDGRSFFIGAQADPPELPTPPAGMQVLDVRPVEAFARGHFARALSVPVTGTGFSTKAAFVLESESVVVCASDPSEAAEAIRWRSLDSSVRCATRAVASS